MFKKLVLAGLLVNVLAGCSSGPLEEFMDEVQDSRERMSFTSLNSSDLDVDMTAYLNQTLPANGPLANAQVELSCGKFVPYSFFSSRYYIRSQYFLKNGVYSSATDAFQSRAEKDFEFNSGVSYDSNLEHVVTKPKYWLNIASGVYNEADTAKLVQSFELPLECDPSNAVVLAIESEKITQKSLKHFLDNINSFVSPGVAKVVPKADAQQVYTTVYLGYANFPQRPEVYQRVATTASSLVRWTFNPFNAQEKAAQLKQLQTLLGQLQLSVPPAPVEASAPKVVPPVAPKAEASAPVSAPKKEIDVSTVITSG
jgi:hypothetical protein